MLPKWLNKYFINTVIKYYEYIILDNYFHLVSVSENSILNTLKATQVSKAAGIDNLSGHFLKVFSKPMSDLSITSEKFPDSCNVAKHKPLYKKGSLTQTQPCNCRPIFLLTQIPKVIE